MNILLVTPMPPQAQGAIPLAPIFPHLFSVPPGSEATASWLLLALRALRTPSSLPAVAVTGAAGLGVYAGCYLLFGATAGERRLYSGELVNTLSSAQYGLQQMRQKTIDRYGRRSEQ